MRVPSCERCSKTLDVASAAPGSMADTPHIPSGNSVLDDALGGGLRAGSLVLVEGDAGAGATEFALAVLAGAVHRDTGAVSRFATGLRAPERAKAEAEALLGDKIAASVRFSALGDDRGDGCFRAIAEMGRGDVLVIESTSAFTADLPPLMRALGDATAATGALVLLLHAPGTLPHGSEVALRDAADVCVAFSWKDGGLSRRRLMTIAKVRGLAPMLEAEDVPVFEVALRHGIGIGVSRVKAVL